MSPGELLGRGITQAGPWRVSRIFTGGRRKSIPGGRSIRSEHTYRRRDLGTARRPVWLDWWVCREVSARAVGGEERLSQTKEVLGTRERSLDLLGTGRTGRPAAMSLSLYETGGCF